MARAVLTLEADASGVSRALGRLRGEARAAQGGMSADARSESRAREKAATDESRARARAEQEALRAKRQAERAATAAANRESRERVAAANRETRMAIAAATIRLRGIQAADRAAEQSARRAERERTTAAREGAREAERIERERTRTTEREARVRARTEAREARTAARAAAREAREARGRARGIAGGVVSTVGSGARAVGAFAMGAHAQIQDARQQRAIANRTIGNAVRNSGGTEADVQVARQRLTAFVDQTGMSYTDVAAALETGQARGSALEAGPGQTRAQALDEALRVIREGNAAGADPGQLLAARGRLGAAGLQGASLNTALRYAMRAAQRGSVEIDQIIQQGLPGASALMGQRVAALGPGATAEQRQRAALQAFQESVAVQEVAASTGRQPGNTANTLSNLQNFLRTPRRQEMILQNIRSAEEQTSTATPEGRMRRARLRALREGMFERDPTRTGNAMRMREGTSPLDFAARLAQATGGDASAAMNILAGGGHGNPQSLLSNMRGLLTFLGGQTPTGQTGAQRVTEMMAGGGISNTEIAGMQNAVESDDLANLTRAQEKGLTALSDNTSALVRMSNAFATWAAANPVAAQAAGAGGGLLSGFAGAALAPMARNGIARALPALAPAANALRGVLALGSGAGMGAQVLTGVAGTLVGGGLGSLLNRALYSDNRTETVDGQRTQVRGGQGSPAYTNAFSGDFWRGLTTSMTQAFDDSIARGTLRVAIDPHDAAHVRSAGTGNR